VIGYRIATALERIADAMCGTAGGGEITEPTFTRVENPAHVEWTQMVLNGVPIRDVAKHFGKSQSGIRDRMHALLKVRNPTAYHSEAGKEINGNYRTPALSYLIQNKHLFGF
jgi:hypothetical protein